MGEIVKDKTSRATAESDRDREEERKPTLGRNGWCWDDIFGAFATVMDELYIILLNGKIAANTPQNLHNASTESQSRHARSFW